MPWHLVVRVKALHDTGLRLASAAQDGVTACDADGKFRKKHQKLRQLPNIILILYKTILTQCLTRVQPHFGDV